MTDEIKDAKNEETVERIPHHSAGRKKIDPSQSKARPSHMLRAWPDEWDSIKRFVGVAKKHPEAAETTVIFLEAPIKENGQKVKVPHGVARPLHMVTAYESEWELVKRFVKVAKTDAEAAAKGVVLLESQFSGD